MHPRAAKAARNRRKCDTRTLLERLGSTLGNRTTTLYDAAGRQIATIDANNNRTTTLYDQASRPVAKIDARGYRNTTVYDAAGRQVALWDARGNRNTFTYDKAGQRTRTQNPLDNRNTYLYDAAGRQRTHINARGGRITMLYDAAGRLVSRYTSGAPGRATYTYDAVGNRTRLWDWTGRYTTTYDSANLPQVVQYQIGRRVTYVYDLLDRRTRLVATGGGRFTYAYDNGDRITRVVNPQGTPATYGYDVANRRTSKKLANGVRTTFSYDAADRLTRLVNIKSSGVTITSYPYKYDNTSNRRGFTAADGSVVTWTYDTTYQLTREQRNGVLNYDRTYTYDALGSRLLLVDAAAGTRTTSTYNAANRLVYSHDSTGRTTYTYNTDGQLRIQQAPGGARTTTVWDFNDVMRYMLLPGGSIVTYTYNADKLRVQKETGTATRRYIYDGQNLLTEFDGSLNQVTVFTVEPRDYGNFVSQLVVSGVQAYFHTYDGLGSTDALTDSAAVVTDTYTYYAFGESRASTGTTANLLTWVGEQGYVRDLETGEFQLHVRQYQPDKGRFKSEDPLGLKAGINAYTYTSNIAITRVDPSGLESPSVDGGNFGVHNALGNLIDLSEITGQGILDDYPSDYPSGKLMPGERIDCVTGRRTPLFRPRPPCHKASWVLGGTWRLMNTRVSNLKLYGEYLGPSESNFDSLPIMWMDARGWLTYKLTTTAVLKGRICCPSRDPNEYRTIEVDIAFTIEFDITQTTGPRWEWAWTFLPVLLPWNAKKWIYIIKLPGYVSLINSIMDSLWNLEMKIAAINEATKDLTRLYQVSKETESVFGIKTNVDAAVSPAIACLLELSRIPLSVDGITKRITIGSRPPNKQSLTKSMGWDIMQLILGDTEIPIPSWDVE